MAVNISSEQSYAYAELLEILSFVDTSLVQKIPNKLMSIFQENASITYERHLDRNIPIENQNISKKTASLIALLSLKYWCETEEEKKELKHLLNENEKDKEKQIRETYNPDNIFNNSPLKDTSASGEFELTKNKFKEEINYKTNSTLPLDYNNLNWFNKLILNFKNFISKILKK